ncbi:hypothetical protein [Spirosoma arcticum]
MKKTFLFPIILLASVAVSFVNPPGSLVGRWQQKVRGATALLAFRADNTFDIFVNGKLFTSGQYTIRQDTFALADPGCNPAYYGTYKLGFFAPDSVRFVTVQDTCKPRNRDMHNFTAGRWSAGAVNPAKP